MQIRTYVVKSNELRSPATIICANCMEKATSRQGGDQLLEKQKQEYTANCSQVEVVNLENAIELERLSVPHQLPPAKDDDVVGDEGDGCLLHR